jgi:two-component SAPR family response regulator
VTKFDARYEEGCRLAKEGRMGEAAAEYEKAIELYLDEYLVEDLYEDWTMIERERLINAYMDMLSRLAVHYYETGQCQESIRACYRILQKDRCHEDSYRLLRRCYVNLGLRGRALSVPVPLVRKEEERG